VADSAGDAREVRLAERFLTRFQPDRLWRPKNEPLAGSPTGCSSGTGDPISITRRIAEGAKGNVRAAMADLEMWMG